MFARPLRAAAALAVVAVLAGLATGCTGSPAPAPSTPTPLSEDEAYAAAEATYRAYVDALNQVDLSDPDTFEPVYALTTGNYQASERKSFSEMHAAGWTTSGESQITHLEPLSVSAETIRLGACVDVSAVSLTDANGQSVVAPDRPDVQAVSITITPADTPTRYAVAGSEGTQEALPC